MDMSKKAMAERVAYLIDEYREYVGETPIEVVISQPLDSEFYGLCGYDITRLGHPHCLPLTLHGVPVRLDPMLPRGELRIQESKP